MQREVGDSKKHSVQQATTSDYAVTLALQAQKTPDATAKRRLHQQ